MDRPSGSAPTAELFNQIASRYDVLNRILSLGIDTLWRNVLLNKISRKDGLSIADLGTGTGDILLTLAQKRPDQRFLKRVGLDPAIQMLNLAKDKAKTPSQSTIEWVSGDATHTPFEANSFDYVTMAFVIRNIPKPETAITEIARILKPSGEALILEFSEPKGLLKWPFLLYFRSVLPWIGNRVSGHRNAYTYLNKSAESFSKETNLVQLFKTHGFQRVTTTPLSGGIATLYHAQK
jgi:demethylmenaquinone methyltransferase/2-methoxy-6-polyprenyl-1,4-benzoquinol methylase